MGEFEMTIRCCALVDDLSPKPQCIVLEIQLNWVN